MGKRLMQSYFTKDVLFLAPDLLGKALVRRFNDGTVERYIITETEAYRGEEDKACHAHKGRTKRTEVMYHDGGTIYIYLIYGMYWLLNIVTGAVDDPQAVLIRGVKGVSGPGRVGKLLQLDKTLNDTSTIISDKLWIEDTGEQLAYTTHPRVGIDYAEEEWRLKPWRFCARFK